MLFDLRGSGRRTTVKVVYVTLAVLMGGGLVLFGIGGSVSGGLIDAITQSDSSSSPETSTFQRRADETQRAAEAKPKNPAGWAEATRARYNLALAGDNFDANNQTFTDSGKAQLRIADEDWQKHLAVAGDNPDDSVAGIMVKAYSSIGLNEPAKAVAAQEVITEARPKSATFANLAVLAYQAGQTRKGDLATKEALARADEADRNTLKSQLDQAKQQAIASQVQNAQPSPTATPEAPTGGGKKSGGSGGKD
jgi:hypothetical protein